MQKNTASLVMVSFQELMHVLVNALIIGFVLSWRDWGRESVDVAAGIFSLQISFVVALAVLLLRLVVQKRFALSQGYFITYSLHKWGVAASIFLAFFFNGLTYFVSAGESHILESKRLRLGSMRYGLNLKDLAKIGIAGSVVGVLLMILIKPIFLLTQNFFVMKIIQVIAAVSFFSLVPIPGSDGFNIFYYRRWLWIFVIVFVGVYFALILFLGVFSYFVAVLLAAFGTYVFLNTIDS